MLYRRVFHPNVGEEFYQLILPTILKSEVLTQLRQDHEQKGIERVTEYGNDAIGRVCRSKWLVGARSVKCVSLLKMYSLLPVVSWAICWLRGQIRF